MMNGRDGPIMSPQMLTLSFIAGILNLHDIQQGVRDSEVSVGHTKLDVSRKRVNYVTQAHMRQGSGGMKGRNYEV